MRQIDIEYRSDSSLELMIPDYGLYSVELIGTIYDDGEGVVDASWEKVTDGVFLISANKEPKLVLVGDDASGYYGGEVMTYSYDTNKSHKFSIESTPHNGNLNKVNIICNSLNYRLFEDSPYAPSSKKSEKMHEISEGVYHYSLSRIYSIMEMRGMVLITRDVEFCKIEYTPGVKLIRKQPKKLW